jgi:hypothetical protein
LAPVTLEALAAPALATVRRVELGEVGRWDISNILGWTPTEDDFASCVAALSCEAVRKPVLKFGHTGEQGQGDPAIGYIDNMAVTDTGVLVGDFLGVPGWLAHPNSDGQTVLASAYPDRSGEWEHDYVCQLGHTHPMVLHAMALLGVVRPGIGTLQSLHDLYTTPPETLMPAAGATPQAMTTPDDVRMAYYAGPGSSWDLWIKEQYIEPAELIVMNEADNSLIRVAYTVGADDTITFAEPQTVKVQYIAARAAQSRPQVAFASKTEARPGTPPQTPAAAPAVGPVAAGDTTPKEAAGMPDLLTSLRTSLGLAEDADEATIQAALTEALEERADSTVTEPAPAAIPEGMALIPAAALADLQEAAKTTTRLASEAHADKRAKVLDGHRTKYAPASRAAWEKQYDIDPEGTTKYLSEAPVIVPVSEVGHGDGADLAKADDSWFPQYATTGLEA